MNCPVCDGRMRAVEKHGVEIDICPDCKGVWLDRGELEKIMEMVTQGGPVSTERREPAREARQDFHDHDEHRREHSDSDHDRDKHGSDRDRDYDPKTGKPRRKESWFGQIFDAIGGGGED